MDDLPVELRNNIFFRLPIKEIGRCMCVSKKWLSYIEEPKFISSHATENFSSSSWMFWVVHQRVDLRNDNDDNLDVYKYFEIPPDVSRSLAICNGVICLLRRDTGGIELWNPTIKRKLSLPSPKVIDLTYFLAFGFDSSNDDYKVVKFSPSGNCEIFSLKRGSWESPEIDGRYKFGGWGRSVQLGINGPLCWLASNSVNPVMLAFDLTEETFQEIHLPECLWGANELDMNLQAYKEHSIAICYSTSSISQVWVMKEFGRVETWDKIWELDLAERPDIKEFVLMGIRNNGQVLWRADIYNKRTVMSSDAELGADKVLGVRAMMWDGVVRYFKESLVLARNENAETCPEYDIVPQWIDYDREVSVRVATAAEH
ncbi:F-box/kelch-repeat protein At3g23880-like [Rutidosis leptorrhynchoides]|uniref:F-box/kelch-repeat protein At3g23880-like n=1 Tax=Rutidosis leptorrhynchoides TaxID=125765 RepID=UPI003A991756